MPVYRYKFNGINIDDIKAQVPPADAGSVSGGPIASLVVWDVTALATSKADIDDYMSDMGWVFVSTDPTDTPEEYVANSSGVRWFEDEFTSAAGQVTFILTQAPIDANSVTVTVNGVQYDDVTDYTVSGTTLTWLNTLFSMDAGEQLIVRYK